MNKTTAAAASVIVPEAAPFIGAEMAAEEKKKEAEERRKEDERHEKEEREEHKRHESEENEERKEEDKRHKADEKEEQKVETTRREWSETTRTRTIKQNGGSSDELLNLLRGGGTSNPEAQHHSPWLTFIILLSIIVHIYDAITKYTSHGITLIPYALMLIIVLFLMYRLRPDSEGISFCIAIAAAYGLPFLLEIMPDTKWILILSAALFLFPVIPLYVWIQFKGGRAAKISMWWITAWIIVLMLYLIVVVNPNITNTSLKGDTLLGLKYVFHQVGNIFSKTGATISSAIGRAIAQATGQPYDGDEESRVGIYVEDIRGIESRYTDMADVFVEARIKAENVKESIDVNTICYIDGIGGGLVSPTMIYDVRDNYDTIVTCNLGRLAPGMYDVKVRINFQFETSSDIKYTFVNAKLKSDQFEKLNIDSKTVATYTGGPVELGLPSLTQPLRIDVDTTGKSNSILSPYPFGVSLKNRWTQGQVIKGIRYMLDVPEEITLIDCSRNSSEESLSEAGRNIYLFEVNTENARDKFDAIQCRMNINNIDNLLGSDLKSVKTFAARVKYEYAVEGSTTVIVEKS